jgi:hypothetical protein
MGVAVEYELMGVEYAVMTTLNRLAPRWIGRVEGRPLQAAPRDDIMPLHVVCRLGDPSYCKIY